MSTPFILRFQEACIRGEGRHISAGTQTMTNVKGGDIDADPHGRRFEALGHESANVGTKTKTYIVAEHGDNDPTLASLSLIPVESVPSLGTNTMTRVRAEGGDTDPGAQRLRVIPPCFSS
jgi:uncharacterized Rossmann fold enzyme